MGNKPRDLGVSQADFARLLGVSRPYVNQLISTGAISGAAVEHHWDPPLIRARTAAQQLRRTTMPPKGAATWADVDARLDQYQVAWEAEIERAIEKERANGH